MIEFYEGTPYTNGQNPDPQRTYVPIFLKRGVQVFFITSKLIAERNDTMAATHVKVSAMEVEDIKARFIASGCRYYMQHGKYENPIVLLDYISEKGYTFTAFDVAEMFDYSRREDDTVPFAVFHGNLNEESAAFRYVIYDDSLVLEIKERIPTHLRQPLEGGVCQ